jgi:hypothetical protein
MKESTWGKTRSSGRRDGSEWEASMLKLSGPARLEEFWRRAQEHRDAPYAKVLQTPSTLLHIRVRFRCYASCFALGADH